MCSRDQGVGISGAGGVQTREAEVDLRVQEGRRVWRHFSEVRGSKDSEGLGRRGAEFKGNAERESV